METEKRLEKRMVVEYQTAYDNGLEGRRRLRDCWRREKDDAPHCVTCCCLQNGTECQYRQCYIQDRCATTAGVRCGSSDSDTKLTTKKLTKRKKKFIVDENTAIDKLLREMDINASVGSDDNARQTCMNQIEENQEETVVCPNPTSPQRPSGRGSYYSSIRKGHSKVMDTSSRQPNSCERCPEQPCWIPGNETIVQHDAEVPRMEDIGSDNTVDEKEQVLISNSDRCVDNCQSLIESKNTTSFRLGGAGDQYVSVRPNRQLARLDNCSTSRIVDEKEASATDGETEAISKSDIEQNSINANDQEDHIRKLKLARSEFIKRISEEVKKLQELQIYLDSSSPPPRRRRNFVNRSTMPSVRKFSNSTCSKPTKNI